MKQDKMAEVQSHACNQKARVYLETYGCQMNFSDTEIISSILSDAGYAIAESEQVADIIFLNTCAVRENAEQRIRNRLQNLRPLKKQNPKLIVGVLGCMAERLREKLFQEEKIVDLIAGPDAYRTLPNLLDLAESGEKAANVMLSLEETYADINPLRKNGHSAFLAIMRGCDNMCAFCIVPYTRGRERSRPMTSILDELKQLSDEGTREVTLLGQNVNSYYDENSGTRFANLMDKASLVNPNMRIRFTTSHPKDISSELIDVIAERKNLCEFIHLPVQSGSSRMLELMNRGHTREDYLEKIALIKSKIPNCSISTDMISGFCTETEADHAATLSLLREVRYDYAFTFVYSVRPNTPAATRLNDDVPDDVKQRRLSEVIALQQKISAELYRNDIGNTHEVLIEGESKRSSDMWMGRARNNRVVVFPKNGAQVGDFVNVKITDATSATLIGNAL
ncbi:RNA modification enzyme, MiaB family [Chloroherpeton thalassium ATCC 35110]|uniref:tRNA-2-methylthio-N(6)-dimethylallyladenosine synthase n=1 Tax=Chloroherpeton thalassium (strain ATCC 35110 / GB-78) TaxID=517418 RepID=MIAB_CHLT3|nr:tRNA (N6-isopentenyl adenosine(37)-C2)-methylthiotransferase MiaB [Chloroherpeton thalassium]B3QVA0.1 RecName: Full=tRNA-2-methylthio-N(6)-dimethylallyladenosine synthase; AltName: Full=(Dimethylallyl)adenosine tRNA methylthiotransferase MiaB; AltName: Full=tRNA-i(6)A37 methylthiotransferase [Chloroherpeton thalassium ATCC 35110]ACF13054.1 RNA modification enzyme, MiaB family [Chloroherpeton thalassium ATCC 35110]